MATTLMDTRSQLCLHGIAWPENPPLESNRGSLAIIQPKVMAQKPIIANCIQKLVDTATSLGTSGPSSNIWFLRSIWTHKPNGISIGSAVFAHMTAECPILYNGTPLCPLKIAPSHGGSEPPSNTWSLGPTQVLSSNGISISSAVFAGLTSVTDRPTDRPRYSVSNNTPHLRT